MRDEKKRNVASKMARPNGASYVTILLSAGKYNHARDGRSVCFRCFNSGHSAKDRLPTLQIFREDLANLPPVTSISPSEFPVHELEDLFSEDSA